MFALSQNESCEKCFETDEQGNVSWSDNAFYGDIGLSFGNSSVSNPQKTGSGKGDVNDLKTEYKKLATQDAGANKYKMQELGDQIKQMGGNTDDIDAETQKTGATNNGKQKTGALTGNKSGAGATNDGKAKTGDGTGLSETEQQYVDSLMSGYTAVTGDLGAPTITQNDINNRNLAGIDNTLNSMKLPDGYTFRPTNKDGSAKQSTAEALAATTGAADSSGGSITNALANAFSPTNIVTQGANALTGKAAEYMADGAMSLIGEGGDWLVDAVSSDSSAVKDLKSKVDKAEQEYKTAQTNEKDNQEKLNNAQEKLSAAETKQKENDKKLKGDEKVFNDADKTYQDEVAKAMMPELIKQNDGQENNKVSVFIIEPRDDVSVTGLLGNKLCEMLGKPVLVLNNMKDLYSGSARAVGLKSFIDYVSKQKVEFANGHENSFGLGISKENLDNVKQGLEEALADVEFVSERTIDIQLDSCQIDKSLIDKFKYYSKITGSEYKPITVCIKDTKNATSKPLSGGKHMRMTKDGINYIKWNSTDDLTGKTFDACGTLDSAYWGRSWQNNLIVDAINVKEDS